MIYCLDGVVVLKKIGEIVVSCGGVGFRVFVPAGVYAESGGAGERIFLFTHMNVKEDAFDLYGFLSEEERGCFRMLIGVSGVGPRSALSILSLYTAQQVALAVASGDHKAFSAVTGIGPKLAQRIALELKDKVSPFGPGETEAPAAADIGHGARQEAMAALLSLGFTAMEAAPAIAKCPGELPAEQLVSAALKFLAGSR